MKIIFWNIGPELTENKLNIMAHMKAEVICFAEGSVSVDNCESIENLLLKMGYKCYYNPKFSRDFDEEVRYKYNGFGLKIFLSRDLSIEEEFSFTEQKVMGRIIHLHIKFNDKKFSLFFIHATSKLAKDISQTAFWVELSMFINSKLRTSPNNASIIMGDFNTQPWEDNLRSQYINSCFHQKELKYYLNKNAVGRLYFNPFFEYIQSNDDNNLIGTFYDDKYISLLDFALISHEISNYDISILTSINGEDLLQEKLKKHIIKHDFDHLPIQLVLK